MRHATVGLRVPILERDDPKVGKSTQTALSKAKGGLEAAADAGPVEERYILES